MGSRLRCGCPRPGAVRRDTSEHINQIALSPAQVKFFDKFGADRGRAAGLGRIRVEDNLGGGDKIRQEDDDFTGQAGPRLSVWTMALRPMPAMLSFSSRKAARTFKDSRSSRPLASETRSA